MKAATSFRKYLLLTAFAGFGTVGLTQGCVITTESADCDECDESPLCHNSIVGGECRCDSRYEPINPGAPEFGCERIPSRPGPETRCDEPFTEQVGDQCYCVPGYVWCEPDDPDDLRCCEDEYQVGTTGVTVGDDTGINDETTTDDTTDPVDPPVEPPLPEDCTEDGLVACSNTDPEDPEGSVLWMCMNGEWLEDTTSGDISCEADGFDFSYGCYDSGEQVEFICGSGPGTPCDDDERACVDADVLELCVFGRLQSVSCLADCRGEVEPPPDVTYDFGECALDVDDVPYCFCCDNPVDGVCPPEGDTDTGTETE